jgi:hypothetical protein
MQAGRQARLCASYHDVCRAGVLVGSVDHTFAEVLDVPGCHRLWVSELDCKAVGDTNFVAPDHRVRGNHRPVRHPDTVAWESVVPYPTSSGSEKQRAEEGVVVEGTVRRS